MPTNSTSTTPTAISTFWLEMIATAGAVTSLEQMLLMTRPMHDTQIRPARIHRNRGELRGEEHHEKARAQVKDNRGGERIAAVAIGDKHKERERGQHGGARHDDIHIRASAQVIQGAGGKRTHNQQQARLITQIDSAGGMRGRKTGIESREYASEAGGRHRQAHYGTLEGRLCLGIIAPLGAMLRRIDR